MSLFNDMGYNVHVRLQERSRVLPHSESHRPCDPEPPAGTGADPVRSCAEDGVSRQWLVSVEQGKPGAELGLILRGFNVLRMSVRLVSYDIDDEEDSARG